LLATSSGVNQIKRRGFKGTRVQSWVTWRGPTWSSASSGGRGGSRGPGGAPPASASTWEISCAAPANVAKSGARTAAEREPAPEVEPAPAAASPGGGSPWWHAARYPARYPAVYATTPAACVSIASVKGGRRRRRKSQSAGEGGARGNLCAGSRVSACLRSSSEGLKFERGGCGAQRGTNSGTGIPVTGVPDTDTRPAAAL